jgi:hypothetical protein
MTGTHPGRICGLGQRCLKSLMAAVLDTVARLIAAERRDVYSDVTISTSLRKERNAKHFALCGRKR